MKKFLKTSTIVKFVRKKDSLIRLDVFVIQHVNTEARFVRNVMKTLHRSKVYLFRSSFNFSVFMIVIFFFQKSSW